MKLTGNFSSIALLALLCIGALAGCASNQKRECESQNWEGIGFRDGKAGRTMDRLGTLADRCSDYDIDVNGADYSRGHSEGLASFCDPGNAFDMGERDQLSRRLDDKRRERSLLDPADSPEELDEDLDELEASVANNLEQRRDVNRQITRWSRDREAIAAQSLLLPQASWKTQPPIAQRLDRGAGYCVDSWRMCQAARC